MLVNGFSITGHGLEKVKFEGEWRLWTIESNVLILVLFIGCILFAVEIMKQMRDRDQLQLFSITTRQALHALTH